MINLWTFVLCNINNIAKYEKINPLDLGFWEIKKYSPFVVILLANTYIYLFC